MRSRVITIVPIGLFASLALAGCNADQAPEAAADPVLSDPLLARALNDPLMVDPDLAWRNEANAVIAWRDGHPLPPFIATPDATQRAREAARLELADGGAIPALPAASGNQGVSLAALEFAEDIVDAVGARSDCNAQLTDDLVWSTRLPETSSIMPHGMIRQAAGVDEGTCVIRVVRYMTPASIEDVLEYHFTKLDRARFRIERFASPEVALRAERRDQVAQIHVREGAGGMTAVDVIHWRK